MATRFSHHLLLVALTISTLLRPISTSTTSTPPSTRPPPTTATTTPPPSIRPPTTAITTRPPSSCSPTASTATPPPSIRPPTTATTTRTPSSCSPATSTATPPPSIRPPTTATTTRPPSSCSPATSTIAVSVPLSSNSSPPPSFLNLPMQLVKLRSSGSAGSTGSSDGHGHGIKKSGTSQAETLHPIWEFFDGEINLGTETDTIPETSGAIGPVYENHNLELHVQPPSINDQLAFTPVFENLDSYNERNSLDTWSIMVKVVHGSTIIMFSLLVNSGILGLKEQIAKRLNCEVDSFDVKFEDSEGDLISITCDDDLMMYLFKFMPLDKLACKLVVVSKKPN
ncbi:hypothetical protein Vadar_015066 [Vaccinium darrowii]|uniref:Uncharacterized protein n=1 Tax=Vaccinium darrowii TaxID=229202 RepID=A0ACB7YE96_9ERIC|nr:hypothetical protein Vadar_015066 [Vaccinium darrowii]